MRRQHAQLFVSLGVFGLILFTMAACGGGSTSPTTGSGSPTSASTPTSFASTAKLTVSGGLTGTYTISDQSSGASEYNQSSSSTQLKIAVADNSWELNIVFVTYIGPGSYTFNGTHEAVTFYAANHMRGWDLINRSGTALTCAVVITNDTPTTIAGTAAAHVKGTISCPKMNSDAPTKEQPITISNGSFDVLIQKTNVP